MKDVQWYELFGGIALKNQAFSFSFFHFQGDCLYAYIALKGHNYNMLTRLEEQTPHIFAECSYFTNLEDIHELHQNSMTIPLQYADDCGFAFVSKKHIINYQMVITPPLLKQKYLDCNESRKNSMKYPENVKK